MFPRMILYIFCPIILRFFLCNHRYVEQHCTKASLRHNNNNSSNSNNNNNNNSDNAEIFLRILIGSCLMTTVELLGDSSLSRFLSGLKRPFLDLFHSPKDG